MNIHYLQHIARYSGRIISRSWLYRLYVAFVLLMTVSFVLLKEFQLSAFLSASTPEIASVYCFFCIMVCTAYQVFPLAFQAGRIFNKDLKLDSMDVIFVHEESNLEYVGGICFGFFRVMIRVLVIVLTITALVNMVLSDVPFAWWAYLFYGITLPVPVLVFFTGWVLLVVRWVPNRALNILLLLGSILLAMIYTGEVAYGVLNPFGLKLPNFFSELTGHSDMLAFLYQRLGWLLLGLALISWTVASFRRLPNRPNAWIRCVVAGVLFFVLGALSLYGSYARYRIPDRYRAEYAATYNRYADREPLSMRALAVDYRQDNRRMEVIARMEAENTGREELQEVVFYLNPGLKISGIRESGGRELAFERDNQAVLLQRPIAPGERLELEITYGGGIDPSVCYLDIRDKKVFTDYAGSISNVQLGRHYYFLQQEQTLLIPECLWYPVTVPPVNPGAPYRIRKDFTHYTLRVANPEGRTVISQGERQREGEMECFTNRQPLSGITLCIGEYDVKRVTVDSVQFELCLSPGHLPLIDSMLNLADTLPALLSRYLYEMEYSMGREYPFRALRLIEVPASFASFYRNGHGSSEYIQPEMILVGESGIGLRSSNFTGQREAYSDPQYQQMLQLGDEMQTPISLSIRVFHTFLSNFKQEYAGSSVEDFHITLPGISISMSRDGYRMNNAYYLGALYYQHVNSVFSADYPVLNTVLANIQKDRSMRNYEPDQNYRAELYAYRKGISYLGGNSLRDAIMDPQIRSYLPSTLLKMKSFAFRNEAVASGVLTSDFIHFIIDYLSLRPFRTIDWEEMNRAMTEELGVDMNQYLPQWYTAHGLPRFIVRNIAIEKVEDVSLIPGRESGREAYRIRADVYNNSDTEGLISLTTGGNTFMSFSSYRQWTSVFSEEERRERERFYVFRMPPQQGYRLAMLAYSRPPSVMLSTNLATNRPEAYVQPGFPNPETRDVAGGMIPLDKAHFFPGEGEWVVDNEDPGFRIVSSRAQSESKLKQYIRGESAPEEKVYAEKYYGYAPRDRWAPTICDGFYGTDLLSGEAKGVGDGQTTVEWTTALPRAGQYRIEIYLPGQALPRMRSGSSAQGKTLQQTYRFSVQGGVVQEESILATGEGWIVLGKFLLDAGEQTITLLDMGIEEQQLYADAVKWVYVGDN